MKRRAQFQQINQQEEAPKEDDSINGGLKAREVNGRVVVDVEPPYFEIFRALGFLLIGSVFLLLGGLAHTGKLGDTLERRNEIEIPLFVIGSLLFLPGFYVSLLAFRAWRGDEGFYYDSIPHS